VGAAGTVLGLEADPEAATHAQGNLAGHPSGSVRRQPVTAGAIRTVTAELGGLDIVVLDPPRTGAGREVMTALAQAAPRVIVYVACDPAALARDIRTARDLGWQLTELVAFDAFPMTHHVECVATLTPAASDPA
jgi:tRNA/tmRNA/rRNA uracil-C5-methylase (TrmA/RlmC/RlmD family)